MRQAWIGAMAGAACALTAGAARADCLDLSSRQPVLFEARLAFHIFPGPPGFADVRRGDAPEPTYLLQLSDPICLSGGAADPHAFFSTVRLAPTAKTAAALHALVGEEVNATLTNLVAANSAHARAPLIATVSDIGKVGAESSRAEPRPAVAPGATTVQAFYEALGAGSGGEAAKFIAPDRRVGPFSPEAMTRFYGGLIEPLRLTSVSADGANRFDARYRFRSQAGVCDGRAIVTTSSRGGESFIESIQALDGC